MTCKNCEKISKKNIDLLLQNQKLNSDLDCFKADLKNVKDNLSKIYKENQELHSIIEKFMKETQKLQDDNRILESLLQKNKQKANGFKDQNNILKLESLKQKIDTQLKRKNEYFNPKITIETSNKNKVITRQNTIIDALKDL